MQFAALKWEGKEEEPAKEPEKWQPGRKEENLGNVEVR